MNGIRNIATCSVATVLGLLAGCGGDDAAGPPEILYGQSVCTDCGMIISDARFASATVVLDARGRPTAWLFDDIGDQIRYEKQHANAQVVARWAHDYETSTWIRAEDAHFIQSEELHTPMASGIAAFAVGADAERQAEALRGSILDLW